MKGCIQSRKACLAASLILFFAAVQLLAATGKTPVAPEWSRFEASFRSALLYSNPVQEATLKVTFTSPAGEKSEVFGFWDGGRTWRVRFLPDQAGRWTYSTSCSERADRGLDGIHGQFLCTAPVGWSRFYQHGPVQVARDRRHLEHADGTPFFWLADTTPDGARLSSIKEWRVYAAARVAQKFTVVQWTVAPGLDADQGAAYLGNDQRIFIDPGFFQRLDAKVDTLKRAGLLSAINPLLDLDTGPGALPDDQALVLARYVVARYSGDPVAWVVIFNADARANRAARWKQIGQTLFRSKHAPVLVFADENAEVANQFRDQSWVDGFGWRVMDGTGEDALKRAVAGPFATEWTREPARVLIPFTPLDNSVAADSQHRFTAEDVRRAMYWGVLLAPTAGVSYGANGVSNWDPSVAPAEGKKKSDEIPMWHKSMFLSSAKQAAPLAAVMTSLDFWRLRPAPGVLAGQPGNTNPREPVAAAATDAGDAVLVYVPEGRGADLKVDAVPKSATATWLNPRTGEKSAATAVVVGDTCQFPAPGAGDWLLVLKAGK